eukprot:TRINITY_DN5235_c1_g1_i1.p1 TRINITY_DN5235_c1_g1~~TRINITY_DN5235_c1_g1_i1.p1  ORF type:complete len:221 (-),score=52.26 TRINITY_DN5235_c1_g1_i1:63-725(-)
MSAPRGKIKKPNLSVIIPESSSRPNFIMPLTRAPTVDDDKSKVDKKSKYREADHKGSLSLSKRQNTNEHDSSLSTGSVMALDSTIPLPPLTTNVFPPPPLATLHPPDINKLPNQSTETPALPSPRDFYPEILSERIDTSHTPSQLSLLSPNFSLQTPWPWPSPRASPFSNSFSGSMMAFMGSHLSSPNLETPFSQKALSPRESLSPDSTVLDTSRKRKYT